MWKTHDTIEKYNTKVFGKNYLGYIIKSLKCNYSFKNMLSQLLIIVSNSIISLRISHIWFETWCMRVGAKTVAKLDDVILLMVAYVVTLKQNIETVENVLIPKMKNFCPFDFFFIKEPILCSFLQPEILILCSIDYLKYWVFH